METRVVNLRREKYDVYIGRGRGSLFGNPFVIGKDGDRAQVIEKYRDYFYRRLAADNEYRSQVLRLKGKILGCFCKPLPCHGDVIVEFLNGTH